MSQKQKDRESYEQFCGELSDLNIYCENRNSSEQEWMRDVFIFNIENFHLQRRLIGNAKSSGYNQPNIYR